eukprot:gene24537-10719_t
MCHALAAAAVHHTQSLLAAARAPHARAMGQDACGAAGSAEWVRFPPPPLPAPRASGGRAGADTGGEGVGRGATAPAPACCPPSRCYVVDRP